MSGLLKKIAELELTSAQLEPSQSDRDSYLEKVKVFTDNFINTIDETDSYFGGKSDAYKLSIKNKTISLYESLQLYTEEVLMNMQECTLEDQGQLLLKMRSSIG